MDNNSPQESWNMATETLKMLNRDMKLASFYFQIGDLREVFTAELSWRRNLKPFLEDGEFKAINDKLLELPKGWVSSGRINPMHKESAYVILDTVYMMMADYMKQKGLLMPKVTDPRAAVLNN